VCEPPVHLTMRI